MPPLMPGPSQNHHSLPSPRVDSGAFFHPPITASPALDLGPATISVTDSDHAGTGTQPNGELSSSGHAVNGFGEPTTSPPSAPHPFAYGKKTLAFLQPPPGPVKPRFELEDDLSYHDSDHAHAHGHASQGDGLAEPKVGRNRIVEHVSSPKKTPKQLATTTAVNTIITKTTTLQVSDKVETRSPEKETFVELKGNVITALPVNEPPLSVERQVLATPSAGLPPRAGAGEEVRWERRRRGSHDDVLIRPRKFIIDVEETKQRLLEQEDLDGDCQITVHDTGPKVFTVGTANSAGFNKYTLRGTYMLSNLLQELAWATDHHRKFITIDEQRLSENPVERLQRLIKYHFWDGLTRRIDAEGLEVICADPKNRSEDHQNRIYVPFHDHFGLQYYTQVAKDRPHLNLDVVRLPEDITPQYVKTLNDRPGILSLALREAKVDQPGPGGLPVQSGSPNILLNRHLPGTEISTSTVPSPTPSVTSTASGITNISSLSSSYADSSSVFNPNRKVRIQGVPFVVPGGRFNEMYGWDSYFEAIGLLADGRLTLAHSMVENFVYQIEHYGKILNANRSYYLSRSQPPFLTDMVLEVYKVIIRSTTAAVTSYADHGSSSAAADGSFHQRSTSAPQATTLPPLGFSMERPPFGNALPKPKRIWSPRELQTWLSQGARASIKELFSIWMAPPRLDAVCGLSKYFPEGIGIPPETEKDHFLHVLKPYADKYGMNVETFEELYQKGEILCEELDEYFVHDRAIRESGHDTTYRFDGRCANLATIDLNSLVYKYEKDLEKMIHEEFGGSIKLRVRRGTNDENLIGFLAWMDNLMLKGVQGSIGNHGGWNTLWAKGVMVYDSLLDQEYAEWAVSSPASPHVKSGLAQLFGYTSSYGSKPMHYFPLPSYVPPTSDSDTSFAVILPASLFGAMALRTRHLINEYLWNPSESLYFDYDCRLQERSTYQTVTALWSLWAGVATQPQADMLVPRAMGLFEKEGGLVCGTEASRGPLGPDRPSRQWDYPYGWAPHQMLAWKGLVKFGYEELAGRLAYRWCYTVLKAFVDFNGVVPEKFDVVGLTHKVDVEYGNVGTDFKFVVREGFGWMNASFQIGMTYLTKQLRRALGTLAPPDRLFQRISLKSNTGVIDSNPAVVNVEIPWRIVMSEAEPKVTLVMTTKAPDEAD
ncbi:alpha,alpha-trehalase nth1 [Chytridiales sp. JEL 0842]|nr:alpha,alpha-trehalase nth1 [Chytridiales sp. JEL 0842]